MHHRRPSFTNIHKIRHDLKFNEAENSTKGKVHTYFHDVQSKPQVHVSTELFQIKEILKFNKTKDTESKHICCMMGTKQKKNYSRMLNKSINSQDHPTVFSSPEYVHQQL
jgi:hypothetical protein